MTNIYTSTFIKMLIKLEVSSLTADDSCVDYDV